MPQLHLLSRFTEKLCSKKGTQFFLIFLFAISLNGCGGFFTSRVQDMTAYFNTYYNASQTYNDCIQKLEVLAARDRNPNRFAKIVATSDLQTKFDSIIERCSKVLQFYPQSVFFDDAMLMIGNSYYYSGEYFRAERKFQELRQNYPNIGLYPEATLGLAKTYYQMKKFPQSFEVLGDSAVLVTLGDDDLIAEGFFLKGQMYYETKDYDRAARNFALSIEFAGENLLKMQASYQLGQVYENQKSYEPAATAYNTLVEHASDYTMYERGSLRYAVMLSKLDRNNEALDFLEQLREDRRNKDVFSSIDYEIGHVLKDKGEFDLAEHQFVFVDSSYKRTDASAKADYQLGYLNEKPFNDFPTAFKYYTKAKGEFPVSEITDSARKRSDVFANYFSLSGAIIRFDSLRNLKEHPELIGVLDSLRKVQKAKADSLAKVKSDSIASYVADSLRAMGIDPAIMQKKLTDDAKASLNKIPPDTSTKQVLDSAGIALKQSQSTKDSSHIQDTLSHLIPEQRDSTNNHPLAIDVEKEVALDSLQSKPQVKNEKSNWDLMEQEEETPKLVQLKGDSTNRKMDSLVVADSIKKDTTHIATGPAWLADTIKIPLQVLIDSLATKEYEMGELMFDKLMLEDSGFIYFNRSLETAPHSFQVPKVLYALADFYSSKGDTTKPIVDSLYNKIVTDFPMHPYAIVARKALGLPVGDTVKVDSLQLLYNDAEKTLLAGNVDGALQKFLQLTLADSTSLFVPKSMYTAGWIYENSFPATDSTFDKAMKDSALSQYKTLIKRFPSSQYALAVQHKAAGAENRDAPFAGVKKFRTDPVTVTITYDRSATQQGNANDQPREDLLQQPDTKLPDVDEPDTNDSKDEPDQNDEPPL